MGWKDERFGKVVGRTAVVFGLLLMAGLWSEGDEGRRKYVGKEVKVVPYAHLRGKTQHYLDMKRRFNNSNVPLYLWKYKESKLKLRLVDKKLTGTRGGEEGNSLKKQPPKRCMMAIWHPTGRCIAKITYNTPNYLEPIKKVSIEEFSVCPAVEYTDVPYLMLRRVIRDWGNLTWWVQIPNVRLAKRGWMWQAIDKAVNSTDGRIKMEMVEFDNCYQARTSAKLRNAFRRHFNLTVNIIPCDRVEVCSFVPKYDLHALSTCVYLFIHLCPTVEEGL